MLAYGLHPPAGAISILQLPVAMLELYFVATVALKVGIRGFLAPLTNAQSGLIGMLIVYALFVSATSVVPSAQIFVSSWIIHIFFFVALMAFFQTIRLDQYDVIWSVLGLTALIHVCVFMIAWAIWPGEIRQNNLPAFHNIRHLGYFVAPAAAITAVQFVTRLEKFSFPLLCFSASTFYIFYTGSRGGAYALLVGLTLAAVYLAWHRQKIYTSRVIVLILVAGALVLASEILPALPWPPILHRMGDAEVDMQSGRGAVWAFAWHSIEQSWFWGYGPVPFSELPNYPLRTVFYHPHNIGLQLLLHWGVAGTLIALAIFISIIPNIWTALQQKPRLALLPATALATMSAHALVDGNLYYPFTMAVAVIAFAHLESLGRQTGDRVEIPPLSRTYGSGE